ncbi:hypothetical protein [Paenibacillus tianmuensis]|uniref:hypothetical protein n=1 Tax=Paenibacillus tianmuensis TaxID=624147 RepID=UPI00115FBC1E|nr:hypothetical protein [Paenibacillus tianmuensis]
MYEVIRKLRVSRGQFWGIVMAVSIFLVIAGCSDKKMTFDQKIWIEARDNESWELRQKMAQYLIEEQTLVGNDKNEIIQLLGKPEDYSDVSKNEMYYTIDLFYGYDIDPVRVEYLVFSLDSNNKVTKYVRKLALGGL